MSDNDNPDRSNRRTISRRGVLAGVGASAALGAAGILGNAVAQEDDEVEIEADSNNDGEITPRDQIEDPIEPENVDPNSDQDVLEFVARLVTEVPSVERNLVDDLDDQQSQSVFQAMEDIEIDSSTEVWTIPAEIADNSSSNTTSSGANASGVIGGPVGSSDRQYSASNPDGVFEALSGQQSAIKRCKGIRNVVKGRQRQSSNIILFTFYHRVNWCWRGNQLIKSSCNSSASGRGNAYVWRYDGVVRNSSNVTTKGYYTEKTGRFKYCVSPAGNSVCVRENRKNARSGVSAFPGGRNTRRQGVSNA